MTYAKKHFQLAAILLSIISLIACNRARYEQPLNAETSDDQKIISDPNNKLTDEIEALEIEYTVWGCACPNWIESKFNERNDTISDYKKLHFYIEPASPSLELPIYFDAFRHRLKITGQFYEKEDYPQGTIETEEQISKARVFRYTSIEVIDKPNFQPDSKIETLTLHYNAFSCTCAQWSEHRQRNDSGEKIHYWLEPSKASLSNADELFDGKNLPLIIKVTGQIVCENGFPRSKNLSKVGQDEASKVFRYTKIEVIQNGKKD